MQNRSRFTQSIFILLVLIGACPAFAAGPKNVIVMIGDGMGFNHIAAGDLYDKGTTGTQSFEQFPVRLAMSTFPYGASYDPAKCWSDFSYASKAKYTDSAPAATAMSTGKKSYDGAIGFVGEKAATAERGKHASEYAKEVGRATGVITTVEISHATPAGFSAHNKNRDNYSQIAEEMLSESKLDLIMGCGHPAFDDDGKPVKISQKGSEFVGGVAMWDKLLNQSLSTADCDGDGKADPWTVIQTRKEFQDLGTATTVPKRLCGVAQVHTTLQAARSGNKNVAESAPDATEKNRRGGLSEDKNADAFVMPLTESVPTLAEMSQGALNFLSHTPKGQENGFFIMIEGGAIDWAAHGNLQGRLIEEDMDFFRAVDTVVAWVNANGGWENNLVIITADHETGYLTGPNSGVDGAPVWNSLVNNGKGKMPGMEFHEKHHTNNLVAFFANGPAETLEKLDACATGQDPVRGKYLDNTDIAKTIIPIFTSKN